MSAVCRQVSPAPAVLPACLFASSVAKPLGACPQGARHERNPSSVHAISRHTSAGVGERGGTCGATSGRGAGRGCARPSAPPGPAGSARAA